jgi:hypothetical protein
VADGTCFNSSGGINGLKPTLPRGRIKEDDQCMTVVTYYLLGDAHGKG